MNRTCHYLNRGSFEIMSTVSLWNGNSPWFTNWGMTDIWNMTFYMLAERVSLCVQTIICIQCTTNELLIYALYIYYIWPPHVQYWSHDRFMHSKKAVTAIFIYTCSQAEIHARSTGLIGRLSRKVRTVHWRRKG